MAFKGGGIALPGQLKFLFGSRHREICPPYYYNMLPVIGAGDRFTDISIVPHPKGFRKVVEKVLQLRKGLLCEGTPAKRAGERPYLAAFYENVSPSVSFADSYF